MRTGRFILVVFAVVAAGLVPTRIGTADEISISHDVMVNAVVAPAQYIIINSKGNIIEIGSNTSQAVIPQVFKDRVAANNQVPMTQNILMQYKTLAQDNFHPGILYQYKPSAPLLSSAQIKVLNLLSI